MRGIVLGLIASMALALSAPALARDRGDDDGHRDRGRHSHGNGNGNGRREAAERARREAPGRVLGIQRKHEDDGYSVNVLDERGRLRTIRVPDEERWEDE